VAEWSSELGRPPGVIGCVLGNEVLDNFPVHVLVVSGEDDVRELYVGVEEGHFVECIGPLSVEALAEPARRAAAHLAKGNRFEVCLEFEGWFRQASEALRSGYVLLVDYGHVEPSLWVENPEGSLVTHGPEEVSSSPIEDPGRKDITCGVNLSAAMRAAEAAGFCLKPLTDQRSWLLSLGLAEIADDLDLAGFEAALEGRMEQATVLQGELSQLLELGAVGGLGDLLVLRGAKDAPEPWP
jgi:SAM-dependent MidA family methyltransferase